MQHIGLEIDYGSSKPGMCCNAGITGISPGLDGPTPLV